MNNLDFGTISAFFNIILSLLLFIQWLWNRAKEQSVKNNIFASRRMISMLNEHADGVVVEKAKDMTENIDATLATLGNRSPFKKRLRHITDFIYRRNKEEERSEIIMAKNENIITS